MSPLSQMPAHHPGQHGRGRRLARGQRARVRRVVQRGPDVVLMKAAYHYQQSRQRREDPAPPGRPAGAHRQHRLARPTKAQRSLAAAQAPAPQAQRRRRGRDRTRTGRLLLGDSPSRLPNNNPLWLAGRSRASRHSRTTVRASGYEQLPPAAALVIRQRTCDETKVLGYPAPAYEPDHTSRHPRTPGAAPPTTTTHPAELPPPGHSTLPA